MKTVFSCEPNGSCDLSSLVYVLRHTLSGNFSDFSLLRNYWIKCYRNVT